MFSLLYYRSPEELFKINPCSSSYTILLYYRSPERLFKINPCAASYTTESQKGHLKLIHIQPPILECEVLTWVFLHLLYTGILHALWFPEQPSATEKCKCWAFNNQQKQKSKVLSNFSKAIKYKEQKLTVESPQCSWQISSTPRSLLPYYSTV